MARSGAAARRGRPVPWLLGNRPRLDQRHGTSRAGGGARIDRRDGSPAGEALQRQLPAVLSPTRSGRSTGSRLRRLRRRTGRGYARVGTSAVGVALRERGARAIPLASGAGRAPCRYDGAAVLDGRRGAEKRGGAGLTEPAGRPPRIL